MKHCSFKNQSSYKSKQLETVAKQHAFTEYDLLQLWREILETYISHFFLENIKSSLFIPYNGMIISVK